MCSKASRVGSPNIYHTLNALEIAPVIISEFNKTHLASFTPWFDANGKQDEAVFYKGSESYWLLFYKKYVFGA